MITYPTIIQWACEALKQRDDWLHRAETGVVATIDVDFSYGTPGDGDYHAIRVEVANDRVRVRQDGEELLLDSPIDMVRDAANMWVTPAAVAVGSERRS